MLTDPVYRLGAALSLLGRLAEYDGALHARIAEGAGHAPVTRFALASYNVMTEIRYLVERGL